MAERLRLINPDAVIDARADFYAAETAERLLAPEPDLVVDAIDNVKAKLHLIATCMRLKLRLTSTMGAAARLDPTMVRVADLSETRLDPFARDVRKLLRKKHGIDATVPTGVTAIYSEEPPLAPVALAYDTDGFECVCPSGDNGLHSCERRNRIEGSATFVPAAFGLTAASVAVRLLCARELEAADPRRLREPSPHHDHKETVSA
jgi:tRNA A37 threonylcarbamoyladenosine dehydratase